MCKSETIYENRKCVRDASASLMPVLNSNRNIIRIEPRLTVADGASGLRKSTARGNGGGSRCPMVHSIPERGGAGFMMEMFGIPDLLQQLLL